MRAVVFEADGVVEVADRPDPAIEEPGDAVLRITRAGICGSIGVAHRGPPRAPPAFQEILPAALGAIKAGRLTEPAPAAAE